MPILAELDFGGSKAADVNRAFHVRTCGIAYKPIPNIVIKADHQEYSNDAGTGVDRFNLALGYLF